MKNKKNHKATVREAFINNDINAISGLIKENKRVIFYCQQHIKHLFSNGKNIDEILNLLTEHNIDLKYNNFHVLFLMCKYKNTKIMLELIKDYPISDDRHIVILLKKLIKYNNNGVTKYLFETYYEKTNGFIFDTIYYIRNYFIDFPVRYKNMEMFTYFQKYYELNNYTSSVFACSHRYAKYEFLDYLVQKFPRVKNYNLLLNDYNRLVRHNKYDIIMFNFKNKNFDYVNNKLLFGVEIPVNLFVELYHRGLVNNDMLKLEKKSNNNLSKIINSFTQNKVFKLNKYFDLIIEIIN